MNSRLFVFLALVSYAVAVPTTENCEYKPDPKGPCAGKKPGHTFCKGEQGIMTCKPDGSIEGKDCGLSVSLSGKQIIGKCKTNKDGVASCVQPERCEYEAPGFKYCAGTGGIATCISAGKSTAVDCGLAVSASGKQIVGKCKTNKDGSGTCVMPQPCEYEAVGFKYCKGDGIVTCGAGGKMTAVDCPQARQKDGVTWNGKCYTVDGKATCESIPDGGPCKGKRPGSYCDVKGGLLTCPEGKCNACPGGQKCSSKNADDRSAKCISAGGY